MAQQTRFYVIRGLQSELAFAHVAFPMGVKGLTLHEDGSVTPSGEEAAQQLARFGPAARAGDRVRITAVSIGKNAIVFEINGGPKKKKKWYEHVQVGVSGAPTVTAPQDPSVANPRGSLLTLQFKDYVPDIAPEQIKQMLAPVLDFSSKSATEAYLDTIPPKAKEAIKNHQVLVGMDQEMVTYAKGRAQKKIREADSEGKPYEEWIYGEPPQDVEFVRFTNGEVVRLEIMKVDGEKIVRTEKELDLKDLREARERKKEEAATKAAAVKNHPTLRRPGEEEEQPPPPQTQRTSGPMPPQDPGQRDPTLGPPPPQGPQVGAPPTSPPVQPLPGPPGSDPNVPK